MFHCAEDYLVTSDPRGGEREENIVNFPCRFEYPNPSFLWSLSLSHSHSFSVSLVLPVSPWPRPFSSSFSGRADPLPGRFRMPIKLTSSSSWRRDDRHGHRAKSNSSVIRCKVARRERRFATSGKRERTAVVGSRRRFSDNIIAKKKGEEGKEVKKFQLAKQTFVILRY